MKISSPLISSALVAFGLLAFGSDMSGQILQATSSGVGVGTSSPGHLLDVSASTGAEGARINADNNGGTPNLFLETTAPGGGNGRNWLVTANYDVAGDFTLRSSNAEGGNAYSAGATRLVINRSGNLGVGTTAPSIAGGYTPKLHLAGAYAAIALEATTPAEKWGIGVDSTGALEIFKSTSNSYAGRLLITNAGNVGIGTISPGSKLEVNGSVRATSFISNTTTYADFVFKPGYQLRSLAEVEAAIARDGHLPDIPSETEVKAHGVDLASQQAKLLQKVEELTLYVIEHQKELARLREENAALREKVAGLAIP
jgi:hypothetical protein